MNECKPNCFEKTEVGGAFFIFHQIIDELSTKHEPLLRTTVGSLAKVALAECSILAQMSVPLLPNCLLAPVRV